MTQEQLQAGLNDWKTKGLIAGIALLVLPGPGWLLIFIGLTILASEYVWAQRLLNAAKRKAEQAKAAVLRKKDSGGTPSS